jgi:hypothetical protein
LTTLTQNQPPIFVYEVWRNEENLRGSIIDDKPFWKAKQTHECVYDLKGREAHYIIVSDDRSITRKEAISFAQAVNQGKVSRLRVDLTPCNQKRPK